MNILTIGMGKYGTTVINQIYSYSTCFRCAAICSTQAELDAVSIDMKFRISTKLLPSEAIDRIHRKLEKACVETDIVILIADPLDFANPSIILQISQYIRNMKITLVGVMVNPASKTTRKHKCAIQSTIVNMVESSATVLLHSECDLEYMQEVDAGWLKHYISTYSGRDTIQELEAFHKWRESVIHDGECAPNGMVQVGCFTVYRLIKAVTIPYVNADKENIIHVLSIPGLLHFATVSASGKNRYEAIRWRTAFNDVLLTSSHAAQGMLLNLTIPKGITPEEAGKICLGIYSYADESVNFYFNISITDETDGTISASVLATGTYSTTEDDF